MITLLKRTKRNFKKYSISNDNNMIKIGDNNSIINDNDINNHE